MRPQVHLYTAVWNDEWMLPYFFRHYDSFVDRYVIYDDGSDDRTIELLDAHPRVERRAVDRGDATSVIELGRLLSDQWWKDSRGSADWVIVTDIDEHLVHPDLTSYLARMKADGVTLIPALGYQMVSREAPAPDAVLVDAIRVGAPFSEMMKPSIFDPNHIVETNFAVGRHDAQPTGIVNVPRFDEVQIRHFKYIGFDRTARRQQELAERLHESDFDNGWGFQYRWSPEQFANEWAELEAQATTVPSAALDADRTHPEPRWWHRYRVPDVGYFDLLRQHQQARADIEELEREVTEGRERLRVRELQLADVRERLAQQERNFNDVVTSRSWKVTAPMRRASERLRRETPPPR